LDKAPNFRVIVAGFVVIKAGLNIIGLAGVTEIELEVGVEDEHLLAKGTVFEALQDLTAAIGVAGMSGLRLALGQNVARA
jgi:hypothetical protein